MSITGIFRPWLDLVRRPSGEEYAHRLDDPPAAELRLRPAADNQGLVDIVVKDQPELSHIVFRQGDAQLLAEHVADRIWVP